MFTESRLCVSPFQISKHSTDFHETWHQSYHTEGHADAVYFCLTISSSVSAPTHVYTILVASSLGS
jgi:hypothetical protein